MFSVAFDFPTQPSDKQHGAVVEGCRRTLHHPRPEPPRQPLFSPGSRLLSLGRYLVAYQGGEQPQSQLLPCVNALTGEQLQCQVYELEDFHKKAHLLLLESEGIHKPLDVCVVDKKVFVVTRTTFGDLHNFLKAKKRLSEAQAAPLFRQIVSLVKDAHQRNIGLRDIKLKKFVFVDPGSTILKLQNLEDAQFLEEGGQLMERHGCPAYVCPEMLQPGSYSGKAADVWSLGVIMYTLLVGHYPFFDTNPQTLFSKIRSGYFHIPDHISYLARSLIGSLLAYDPLKRVSASAVLEHPWFSRAYDEPMPLPPLKQLDQTVPMEKLYCNDY